MSSLCLLRDFILTKDCNLIFFMFTNDQSCQLLATIKKNGERGIIQVALHFDKTGNQKIVVDFGTALSQCHIYSV